MTYRYSNTSNVTTQGLEVTENYPIEDAVSRNKAQADGQSSTEWKLLCGLIWNITCMISNYITYPFLCFRPLRLRDEHPLLDGGWQDVE